MKPRYYFARTHGIPVDPAEAVRQLLDCTPLPVQVAAINDRVFLVNASLGRPYARCSAAFGSDLEPVHASADLMMVVCV